MVQQYNDHIATCHLAKDRGIPHACSKRTRSVALRLLVARLFGVHQGTCATTRLDWAQTKLRQFAGAFCPCKVVAELVVLFHAADRPKSTGSRATVLGAR